MVVKPNQKNLTKNIYMDEEEIIEMEYELLQPWSTFVMKTQLPPPVLEKMMKITDEVIANQKPDKAEQRDTEDFKEFFCLEHSLFERENLLEFFLNTVKNFAIQQTLQQHPFSKELILNDEWDASMEEIWIVSQKDNEYLPSHIHSRCRVSCVTYLKIPEYLPNRKPHPTQDNDGAITIINNTTRDPFWGASTLTLQPQVGDFYIFPAALPHFVYPFRTKDGKGERRSVAFNANFTSKRMRAGKLN